MAQIAETRQTNQVMIIQEMVVPVNVRDEVELNNHFGQPIVVDGLEWGIKRGSHRLRHFRVTPTPIGEHDRYDYPMQHSIHHKDTYDLLPQMPLIQTPTVFHATERHGPTEITHKVLWPAVKGPVDPPVLRAWIVKLIQRSCNAGLNAADWVHERSAIRCGRILREADLAMQHYELQTMRQQIVMDVIQ